MSKHNEHGSNKKHKFAVTKNQNDHQPTQQQTTTQLFVKTTMTSTTTHACVRDDDGRGVGINNTIIIIWLSTPSAIKLKAGY